MYKQHPPNISNFFITGINYKKTDAYIRGRFAINTDKYQSIISSGHQYNVSSFFVLSTCNRTEIYGFTPDVEQLKVLLCEEADGSPDEFSNLSYTKCGLDAMKHLFDVAAGLDSQVLGDYEIVGQIKQAVKFSKKQGFIDPYLERMINEVLQASRKIRSNTSFSSGTVSVSFAAVQFAKAYFNDNVIPKILLVGTGKIGRNACKNIVDCLPGSPVVLMNRTHGKAEILAAEFSLGYDYMENLQQCIDNADIILIATNADQPLIRTEHFKNNSSKLIIDLSVPCNVEPAVGDIPGLLLVNVDDLSKVKDETLQMRATEIPKVKAIIGDHIASFLDWYEMRKHVPVLQAVKDQLLKMQSGRVPHDTLVSTIKLPPDNRSEENIQKVINGMAVKMRTQNNRGCHYIEAMNDFIAVSSN